MKMINLSALGTFEKLRFKLQFVGVLRFTCKAKLPGSGRFLDLLLSPEPYFHTKQCIEHGGKMRLYLSRIELALADEQRRIDRLIKDAEHCTCKPSARSQKSISVVMSMASTSFRASFHDQQRCFDLFVVHTWLSELFRDYQA
jgi:hypothetical protein